MKKIVILSTFIFMMIGCKLSDTNQHQVANKELGFLLEKYYEEYLQLYPLSATSIGDARYNNKLNLEFTESFRQKSKEFYKKYAAYVDKFDYDQLIENDKISVDVLKREMQMGLKYLSLNNNLMPLNQFEGMHLTIGQYGSGESAQPFKTTKDYNDWIERATAFSTYIDSAIGYFKKGMQQDVVLPKSLVLKMIPQCRDMVVTDASKSLFWGPIAKMPSTFSEKEKNEFQQKFTSLINNQLVVSYKKLGDFLEQEYLPKARVTSGINALKDGDKVYKYWAEYWTTTNKTPEEIHGTGLAEVQRIKEEMEKVKLQVEYKGDMKSFFEFLKNDPKFMPYKNATEVLQAFKNIQVRIDSNLSKMFTKSPKTKFEIRQTEAFRAASASAEYMQSSEDGTRPGIFYVPIVDATKFNTTSGMESLFLHEAIPGHHYQVSLQQENKDLPKFRRFNWYGAYGEGWALYTESLGKELGLYTDPYQYMGALGDEMHRAIRLVVDVAIHTKNMTREQAITYMMENEAINEQGATAEIERYMAIPGQALSYKMGSLKIWQLRNKYATTLGAKFNLAKFHDAFLKDGCVPLDVLEKKMDNWAAKQ